jgi:hypothetical protein
LDVYLGYLFNEVNAGHTEKQFKRCREARKTGESRAILLYCARKILEKAQAYLEAKNEDSPREHIV